MPESEPEELPAAWIPRRMLGCSRKFSSQHAHEGGNGGDEMICQADFPSGLVD